MNDTNHPKTGKLENKTVYLRLSRHLL